MIRHLLLPVSKVIVPSVGLEQFGTPLKQWKPLSVIIVIVRVSLFRIALSSNCCKRSCSCSSMGLRWCFSSHSTLSLCFCRLSRCSGNIILLPANCRPALSFTRHVLQSSRPAVKVVRRVSVKKPGRSRFCRNALEAGLQ